VRSVLIKIAAEAELLRLRALLARQGRRAAFGIGAFIFAVAVLVLAEVLGWQVLRLYVSGILATCILLGINLVIAAVFGLLAIRSSPAHAEREALRVRREAFEGARGGLSIAAAFSLLRLPSAFSSMKRASGSAAASDARRKNALRDIRIGEFQV
jgi:hypothetical protein